MSCSVPSASWSHFINNQITNEKIKSKIFLDIKPKTSILILFKKLWEGSVDYNNKWTRTHICTHKHTHTHGTCLSMEAFSDSSRSLRSFSWISFSCSCSVWQQTHKQPIKISLIDVTGTGTFISRCSQNVVGKKINHIRLRNSFYIASPVPVISFDDIINRFYWLCLWEFSLDTHTSRTFPLRTTAVSDRTVWANSLPVSCMFTCSMALLCLAAHLCSLSCSSSRSLSRSIIFSWERKKSSERISHRKTNNKEQTKLFLRRFLIRGHSSWWRCLLSFRLFRNGTD